MKKLFRLLICLVSVLALASFMGRELSIMTEAQAKEQAYPLIAAQPLEQPQRLPFERIRAVSVITPEIVSSFSVPGNRARGLAWGNGSLWLVDVDKQVYRLDSNGIVQQSFPITVTAYDLAWFENSLWAHDGSKVYQLNSSGQVTTTLNVGYWWNGAIEWVGNDLYVTDYNLGEVHKHNRLGAHLLSWATSFFGHPTGMTYDGTGLWIGDSCEGGYNHLYRYAFTGTLLSSINLNSIGIPCDTALQSTRGLAWDGQYLWITADDLFTVYRLDITPPPPPTLSLITPNQAVDNIGNVPVIINGANFRSPITAHLETTALLSVTLQNSNTLQAYVPVGSLSQGVYDLTVSSDSKTVTLPSAFTVKPAYIPPSPSDEFWTSFGLAEKHNSPNSIGVIMVDPHNSNIIYASDENGTTADEFQRTINGGQSWQTFRSDHVQAVAIHPTDSNTVYVAPGYGDYSIYKTVNGGASWLETGCCLGGYGYQYAVAIDPANPNTVYAGVIRASTNTPGVYKSTNGGSSWSNLINTINVRALTFDPANSNVLYAVAENLNALFDESIISFGGVYKSTNAGLTWSQVMTHTQANALAIDPHNSQVLYVATEGGGIFKSVNGGASWFRANTGLSHLLVRALVVHPENSQVLYAGLWEGGVFRSLDGGASWQPINTGLTNTYINSLAIDPQQPDIIYAGTDGKGIFKWAGPPPPPPGATYAKVINDNGPPLKGAQVYHNGHLAPGVTDAAGNLILTGVQPGDKLVALSPIFTQPTVRQEHSGWAYRVYKTSLTVKNDSSLNPFTVVSATGSQTLAIKTSNTLILFNLLISIEWDAEDEYTEEISGAVQSASDYLYDLTDGQMAFGQVAIYDNGQHWGEADIQISTSNIVRPHAFVGGLTSTDKAHVIRVGRGWDGYSGDHGSWNLPDGYRTLTHEFGHYALYLYDEYFAYVFNQNGKLTGETPALCTGPQNRNSTSDATNASAMDWQYDSSELSARGVSGLWSPLCEQTAQWQLNPTPNIYTDPGESTWETLVRKYADTSNPARWQLITPVQRGGIMAGPAELPSNILAFPRTSVTNTGISDKPHFLTVYGPDGQGYWGAIVSLQKGDGRVIAQGFTNGSGQLKVYGVEAADTIRAASFDGGLYGSLIVGSETNLNLSLAPVGGLTSQANSIPHMRVIAQPGQNPSQIDLLISLRNFGPNANPAVLVTQPDSEVGYTPQLNYSASEGTYNGAVSFSATERGTGRIRVLGNIQLQSTYRLQEVVNSQGYDVFSDDGNLRLYLKGGSLPGNKVYFTVMPPGATPGPLPAGLVLIGNTYDVVASGLVPLQQPAVLSLRYDGALVNPADPPPTGLSLYRWDPNSQSWQAVPSELDEEHKTMVTSITNLGIYALLAQPGSWHESTHPVFLPIVVKK